MGVYMDGSGDPGTGERGSRWLTFGCALAPASADADLRRAIQKAVDQCGATKRGYLHFRDMKHHDKLGALGILQGALWSAVLLSSDTTDSTFPRAWIYPKSPSKRSPR
jgi:hypothetical protein